jgi:hypothetical protein
MNINWNDFNNEEYEERNFSFVSMHQKNVTDVFIKFGLDEYNNTILFDFVSIGWEPSDFHDIPFDDVIRYDYYIRYSNPNTNKKMARIKYSEFIKIYPQFEI